MDIRKFLSKTFVVVVIVVNFMHMQKKEIFLL